MPDSMLEGMKTILIRNGSVATAQGMSKADLLVEGEKIARIAENIPVSQLPKGSEVVDASELIVLPGLIDAHTHYHLVSRGTVTADSFAEGSLLAAFGGVTTVIDFSDHDKGKTARGFGTCRIDAMKAGIGHRFRIAPGCIRDA